MSAHVDVLAVPSFAGRGHAQWMVTAGANPREKGIHDAAFGHYGVTAAKVSFEHEYSHMPEYGAKMAADYAERLVACADAMKGVADPRAFVAAVAELIEVAAEVRAAHRELPSIEHPTEVRQEGEARIGRAHYALDVALARVGGAK